MRSSRKQLLLGEYVGRIGKRYALLDNPISTATWRLTYKEVGDRAKGLALTRMLWWATHDGQQYNQDLAYATVPPELTARSEDFIRQITVQGQPIFPEARCARRLCAVQPTRFGQNTVCNLELFRTRL